MKHIFPNMTWRTVLDQKKGCRERIRPARRFPRMPGPDISARYPGIFEIEENQKAFEAWLENREMEKGQESAA